MFEENCFSGQTLSTSASTKRTCTACNDQQHRLMNASHYRWRPSYFFDDIIFVFLLLFLSTRTRSSSRRCPCSLSVRQNVSNRPGTTKGISESNFYSRSTTYIYLYIIAVVIYICESFDLRPKVEATFHLTSTIKIWQIGSFCAA